MKIYYQALLCFAAVLCLSLQSGEVLAQGKTTGKTVCKDNSGMIIFDMTANPDDVAINVNLDLVDPCGGKGDTAIKDGFGSNAINIDDWQVLVRERSENPDELKLLIGESNQTVIEDQFGTNNQNTQFAFDGQLFDLDRLRKIADWLSSGTTAIATTLPAGTYGTISFDQFLDNIANNRVHYGVTRVLVPLELGTCTDATNCSRNALGAAVDKSTLYGLCTTTVGLCACAAGPDIKEGATICGHTFGSFAAPNNRKIKVRGSLMWDFVASQASNITGLREGEAIPLKYLPWVPRELYFKVTIPIQVNWEWDLDDDGAMDNMLYIKSLSNTGTAGSFLRNKLSYDKVPPSNKAEYEFHTGVKLTRTVFDQLDIPTQYHLLMAAGYATSWETAFAKLGITGAEWTSIPGITPPLGLPSGLTGTITADDVRSRFFEDIPAYLYTGGLIDMHSHVNISGLVYVPQGMELEAKNSFAFASLKPTRQYIIGSVIVRDTFFMEAKDTTITVFSSDPTSYSTALLSETAAGSSTTAIWGFATSTADDGSDKNPEGGNNRTNPGGYNPYDQGDGGSDTTGNVIPEAARWIEIQPQDLPAQ